MITEVYDYNVLPEESQEYTVNVQDYKSHEVIEEHIIFRLERLFF